MIKSVRLEAGKPPESISLSDISRFLEKPRGIIWVSLEKASNTEIESILSGVFNFHPLAIEDCESIGYQTPKVDDFDHYLFIIANAIHPDANLKDLATSELNIFLSEHYIVTCFTDEAMSCVQNIWQRMSKDDRLSARGADFICHAILDTLVDEYMPLLDKMDEEVEWLEDQVLANPETATLERLLTLKHMVMSLRRVISPQRELINRLTRDEFLQISAVSRIYFRDIYDHLVRIQDMSESIRDIVSGAVDIYLNSTSLRLNTVMKALTIVSTIFLPLTFLAGVYGMNFKYFPELELTWAYPALWFVFLLIVVLMLTFFKKRQWF
ncbi:magnesium/cobalt transporter CorA [Leptolinea tardivitalis]|uniref:Magnesium transport protein CorA n=1 Tax=Leptolinea tardivitalis TaxID=229920 RepID=A0A0P6XIF0_9CHLR|nr:magnesium/cobalt transporter CorA [Leptolinea tardivitalis]KPL74734.1 magnesium transporter [Leptolinea tardivitalis]GAP22898.1 magnesium Mg(2+) and cobalt Co(2+) transport protein [Leptolinea tardivitalis]